jgi:Lon protease-like protein
VLRQALRTDASRKNSMKEHLLPLFPLEVVLFPNEILPLHIFEDRYKRMIGECLKSGELSPAQGEFGVVCAHEGKLEPVGCTARITKVIRRYDDGRLDILTRGHRRFEILLTDDERSYLRGAVTFFEDDDAGPLSETEMKRAWSLLHELMKRLPSTASSPVVPPDSLQHSFHITATLPLGLEFKQQLLALRSERERMRRLTDLMAKLIPALDLRERARTKASGNGHVTRVEGSP